MQNSDNVSKKSVSSLSESVENGGNPFSYSEWNLRRNELYVTCLNHNGEKKENQLKII